MLSCQLGIVSYHPSVQSMQGCHTTVTSRPSANTSDCESDTLPVGDKKIPKLTPILRSGTEVIEETSCQYRKQGEPDREATA